MASELKSFEVTGGRIHISDPCYQIPTENQDSDDQDESIWNLRAKNGTWIGGMVGFKEGDFSNIKALYAHHEDFTSSLFDKEQEPMKSVDVDSGQMGIWDAVKYPLEKTQFEYYDKNSFYRRVCNLTSSNRSHHCIDNMGCVSSTAYGDGTYDVFICMCENQAVGVKIVFTDKE